MSSPQAVAKSQQAGGSSFTVANPRLSTTRADLPDRNVTADTIEDAYVCFIFYCNPALPLGADTVSLREAFANPPKSGGKSFSPFVIFELVRKFYRKEIKTWTELTTRLGVEPPDLAKDESVQKVAQYGVRLKKWMNSMHVKAFFEYLMDIANDYWTSIPDDPNPIGQPVRDGVAIEDDMALRALLPHIRPKRGRKRPEADDSTGSPVAQRQRTSPPLATGGFRPSWTDHDARAQGILVDTRPDVVAAWGLNDAVQTPLSRYPNSAITPSTRSSFWDDALEPRSAITPSKPKLSAHRRGPKNVSSAWKPRGADGNTKTRGRPPINRAPVESPPNNPPPMTSWAPTPDSNPSDPPMAVAPKEPMPMTPDPAQMHPKIRNQVASAYDATAPMQPAHGQVRIIAPPAPSNLSVAGMDINPLDGSRPARPNISLQVPERQGGTVRLATPPLPPPLPPPPPPMLPVNGQPTNDAPTLQGAAQGLPPLPPPPPPQPQLPQPNGWDPFSQAPTAGVYDQNAVPPSVGATSQADSTKDVPRYFFENLEDRTNVDGLVSYFTHVLHNSDWIDPQGNQQEIAGMDECTAMVNATVEHMYKNAESSQAFLINLAALCGAKMLMSNRPRCYRVETSEGVFTYYFDWQYRFGPLKGQFTMTHSVPVTMWKKPGPRESGETSMPEEGLTSQQWQAKFGALMDELEKRDRELYEMQNKVIAAMKGDGA